MNWSTPVVLKQRDILVLQGKWWCSLVTSVRARRFEGTSLSMSTFYPCLVTLNSNQTTTIAQCANMWLVAEVRNSYTSQKVNFVGRINEWIIKHCRMRMIPIKSGMCLIMWDLHKVAEQSSIQLCLIDFFFIIKRVVFTALCWNSKETKMK